MWPAMPGNLCSTSTSAASKSMSSSDPSLSGGTVNRPKRKPLSGGKYFTADGCDPSPGK